jgi:hypothetical protein
MLNKPSMLRTVARIGCVLSTVACCALLTLSAQAQQYDSSAAANARILLAQADQAWDEEKYEQAPTIANRRAECLEKLGRLMEASELYVQTSRVQAGPDATEQFKQAIAVAGERAVAARSRLGTLIVTITGERPGSMKLLVGGREIPVELAEVGYFVDPGIHEIVVTQGKRAATEKVTVGEKETVNVELALLDVVPDSGEPGAATGSADASHASGRSSQAIWGWTSLGIGAAGMVFGTTTGIVAIGKRSSLDGAKLSDGRPTCVHRTCRGEKGTIDSYQTMRTLSTVGFVVGIVGVGTGVTLLLTTPKEKTKEVAGIRPWVGIGSAGLEGSF